MFPPQFHDKFDTLTRIREVVRLGPERGLSYWVGEKVSKDIKRGKKILSSAKKGHEEIYGTKKEKQERYKKYQKAIDELNHKNEKLSFTELSNRVGRHFGKSPRTIRNHTTPPKKR